MKPLPLAWAKANLDFEKKEFIFDVRDPFKGSYKGTALEAAVYTVNYICEKYPPPYTLCVSGGIDSQAMLYAWIVSGKPFKTFCARYSAGANHNLNDYDIEHIEKFANNYNVKINYYDLDLPIFLENEHDSYARKYLCTSPQLITHMKFADIINEGTILYAGNFLTNFSNKTVYVNFLQWKAQWAMYLFARLSNQNIVPWFLCETAELAFSFKKNFEVEDPSNTHLYDTRLLLYQTNEFPIIPQPKKSNGFEKVKEWYDANYPITFTAKHKLNRDRANRSERSFDIMYRNSYQNLFDVYKYMVMKDYDS